MPLGKNMLCEMQLKVLSTLVLPLILDCVYLSTSKEVKYIPVNKQYSISTMLRWFLLRLS